MLKYLIILFVITLLALPSFGQAVDDYVVEKEQMEQEQRVGDEKSNVARTLASESMRRSPSNLKIPLERLKYDAEQDHERKRMRYEYDRLRHERKVKRQRIIQEYEDKYSN